MVVYSLASTTWLVLIQPFMGVLFSGAENMMPAGAPTTMPALAGVQRVLGQWLAGLPPFVDDLPEYFVRPLALLREARQPVAAQPSVEHSHIPNATGMR